MKSSQVPFRPSLEGFFASRFYRALRKAIKEGWTANESKFRELVDEEIKWSKGRKNKVQKAIYEAVWRLLHDLQRVGWSFSWSKNCLMLTKPTSSDRVTGKKAVNQQKEQIRRAMSFARTEKIKQYQEFIERMLFPTGNGQAKLPVTALIGDGALLGEQLLKARRVRSDDKRIQIVNQTIEPYLQFVNEKDRCQFTGHKLRDIWRFFRFTWANPPETTPGRTLLFLVRDAAQEFHPVIGIFSLENAALRIKCRDEKLGWDPSWFEELIQNCKTKKELEKKVQFLLDSIDQGLKEIKFSDVGLKRLPKKPTLDEVKRLAEYARMADRKRMEALKKWETGAGKKQKQSALGAISQEAEDWLYKRKKAEGLSKLLGAKRVIQKILSENSAAEAAHELIESEAGISAIRVALFANKNRHVGTSILELNVCGAIPPYNHILGGKLAALLAMSPKVVEDYRKRYGKRPSDIATRMKGKTVVRPAELVFVGTTSLYGASSSQYNRLKIPKDVFGSRKDVTWKKLGVTDGYGTLHIAPQTLVALENVVKAKGEALRVNHIFGEGASPKFRSLRTGIEAILESKQRATTDLIGKHEMKRIVFGAEIATNCIDVLTGMDDAPKYYFNKTRNPEAGTQRVVDYWRERWLLSRINHLPALKALTAFDAQAWLQESFSDLEIEMPAALEELQVV